MAQIEEAIQRTLERLQTGWQPTREEINQITGLPIGEIVGASIEDGFLRLEFGDLTIEEEVLWVAPDQSWILTGDGFYWLSDGSR
jgi:hypothetical protein